MLAKFLIAFLLFFNPVFFAVNQYISQEHSSESIFLNDNNFQQGQKHSLASSLYLANPNFLPIRNWGIGEPDIKMKSGLGAIFRSGYQNKILYQNNANLVLPIASLTKLMTAIVAVENMSLSNSVIITGEAIIRGYGDNGNLAVNEELSVEKLLYALLMESSNDAAYALKEYYDKNQNIGEGAFVSLMNRKAGQIGLKNTFFTDPSGYDSGTVSTAYDIIKLTEYSFKYPIIWEILRTKEISFLSEDKKINHWWVNTDRFLNYLPNIVGGKTGYTEEAGECLVLVLNLSDDKRLITVVLGTEKRFLQTERLINWINKAYKW